MKDMKVKFTEIKNTTEKKQVQELYNKSVPAHEKIYFHILWWKRKRKRVSFVSIYHENKWVGFIFYSYYKDLVYVWFFATYDTTTSKEYDSAMFAELKRLYPNHRIAVSIEAENENADNAKHSAREKQFYKKTGFKETGYFVKRKTDSFEIMLIGKSFDIEEFYTINKIEYPLIGRFIVSDMKKQMQKNIHLLLPE
ncbi:MAG: hypothetical protein FWE42_02625 [Defluviitaleaceae bacterium]|nr:hypothetical protein [Defluviitaleaceae bacterium]